MTRTPMMLAIATVCGLATVAVASPAWQPRSSQQPLSATDAVAYCTSLGAGWRLPVRAELEELGVDTAGRVPRSAPWLPADGYLWSGEDVSDARKGQHWIMNLANGHIFNGSGRTGYAKCVRGAAPKVVAYPLPAGYLYVGPANAKLTIVTAVQLDYIWNHKAWSLIKRMLAQYSVRFELHAFTISPRYVPVAIAACAVGRQQKFDAFQTELARGKIGSAPTAAESRSLAIVAGVDPVRYDKAIRACQTLVAADALAYRRKVTAAPTFFIGKQQVVGVYPTKLEAAIKQALGKP